MKTITDTLEKLRYSSPIRDDFVGFYVVVNDPQREEPLVRRQQIPVDDLARTESRDLTHDLLENQILKTIIDWRSE